MVSYNTPYAHLKFVTFLIQCVSLHMWHMSYIYVLLSLCGKKFVIHDTHNHIFFDNACIILVMNVAQSYCHSGSLQPWRSRRTIRVNNLQQHESSLCLLPFVLLTIEVKLLFRHLSFFRADIS